MDFSYFSHNGTLLPIAEAMVPLHNIAYSYGFGVYETVRVTNGVALFLDLHTKRLIESARIIELDHGFDEAFIRTAILSLVKETASSGAYNLKVLLIGGSKPDLFIQCLRPHFPDRKLYKQGVSCITEQYERPFPQAKTLNMLRSYIANKHALEHNAFEAILVNGHGEITEGTRSNFFAFDGDILLSPPAPDCLHGVTRQHIIELTKSCGFSYREVPLPLQAISDYDSVFITSTSFKIMPIQAIDQHSWKQPLTPQLQKIMKSYDALVDDYIESNSQQNI